MKLKEGLFQTRNSQEHKIKNSNIEETKKNNEGEFDLSKFMPLSTKELLDMKTSYGFYLNRFLNEYNRMKKLNSVIYKDKIQKCYRTQNSIASELCAVVESLLSSLDLYNGDTPIGNKMIDKPKVKDKKEETNEMKNEIIEKNDNENKKENINEDTKNENKINENKINEDNKQEEKKKNLEDSDFNLIKDDK